LPASRGGCPAGKLLKEKYDLGAPAYRVAVALTFDLLALDGEDLRKPFSNERQRRGKS
jgi:hypothetical protein